jgi:hypothetical protein
MSRRVYVDGKVWDEKLQLYKSPTGWNHIDGLTRTPKMLFEIAVTPRCEVSGFHLAKNLGPRLPRGVKGGIDDPFALFMGLHFGSTEVGRLIFSLAWGDNICVADLPK